MKVDSKFVVELQGKQFITYDGLLDMAHGMGLVSITTELLRLEDKLCVVKATAKTGEQSFDGIGDATPENVNRMIAKHMIRMAETRAKARALRDLTNVGMVAVEELGGEEKPEQKPEQGKRETKPEKTEHDSEWQAALGELVALAKQTGTLKEMPGIIKEHYGADKSDDMTLEQLQDCIRRVAKEAMAGAK